MTRPVPAAAVARWSRPPAVHLEADGAAGRVVPPGEPDVRRRQLQHQPPRPGSLEGRGHGGVRRGVRRAARTRRCRGAGPRAPSRARPGPPAGGGRRPRSGAAPGQSRSARPRVGQRRPGRSPPAARRPPGRPRGPARRAGRRRRRCARRPRAPRAGPRSPPTRGSPRLRALPLSWCAEPCRPGGVAGVDRVADRDHLVADAGR